MRVCVCTCVCVCVRVLVGIVPLRAIYTKADNTTLLVEGDTVHRPQLAQTLETLSEDPDTFYTGSMAQQIVDDVVAHGGE